MTASSHKKIRWRVRRCPEGWLPSVLVGEVPMILPCEDSKGEARKVARAKAAQIRAQFSGEY